MPTNRIEVEYDGSEIECKVWDNDGNKYDATSILKQAVSRLNRGGAWTDLDLVHGSNSLNTSLKFRSYKKEIKCDVDASVVNQIIEMGASSDNSQDEDEQ